MSANSKFAPFNSRLGALLYSLFHLNAPSAWAEPPAALPTVSLVTAERLRSFRRSFSIVLSSVSVLFERVSEQFKINCS